jgi:hypothetical protein
MSAAFRAARLDWRAGGVDRHRFRHRAGAQLDRAERQLIVRRQHDVRALMRREARQLHLHGVEPGLHRGEQKVAARVADDRARVGGALVEQRDRRARHGLLRLVDDRAGDRACDGLRQRIRRYSGEYHNESGRQEEAEHGSPPF